MTSMHLKKSLAGLLAVCALLSWSSLVLGAQKPQLPADVKVYLEGLAPVSALDNSKAGKAALAANLTTTTGLQNGEIRQTTPLPFAAQQRRALSDAFINFSNLAEVSDGLGTTLGAAWRARNQYLNREWSPDKRNFTSISPVLTEVTAYTLRRLAIYMYVSKNFFADGTLDHEHAMFERVFSSIKGQADIFGKSYNLPAGSKGANPYGNSRPYQTAKKIKPYYGLDHFGAPSMSRAFTRGPLEDLGKSPSYPSGHTVFGYAGAILLGAMVPERYPQLIARAAEYGNSRVLVGAHYTMDVLAGRTLALYSMAQLLANKPEYMGHSVDKTLLGGPLPQKTVIKDFRAEVKKARTQVRQQLQEICAAPVSVCAQRDHGRFKDAARNAAFYASTQTYDQPVVHPEQSTSLDDVSKLAPHAGYLLTVAYPELSLAQANRILTRTQGPGGRFLDTGSRFGVYSRINLYRAALVAQRVVATQEMHSN